MKKCSGCDTEKELTDFNKNKNNKDGLQYYCKSCQKSFGIKNRSKPEHKGKKTKYQKQYRSTVEGLAISLFLSTRARAKQKSREFDLSSEWLKEHIEPLTCEATGMKLVLEIDDNVQQGARRPSIDRIDSSKGYTKDNCQIVSVIYNRAKSDGCHEDVIEMALALISGGIN